MTPVTSMVSERYPRGLQAWGDVVVCKVDQVSSVVVRIRVARSPELLVRIMYWKPRRLVSCKNAGWCQNKVDDQNELVDQCFDTS